jgi:acetolactate synthase I/II/III large subunit
MPDTLPATTMTVGEAIIATLERAGVTLGFGVISIHNMPLLDAMLRRPAGIRFIPARGEAGAVNMADAAARVSGRVTLAVTSTGTGAGNAAGALVEAQTAGTPLIHLTGQIDSPWLDRGWGVIHEAADQPGMLRAVSKAFFRITRADEAVAVIRRAVQLATTPPCGPVSVEIPIDVQKAACALPAAAPLPPGGLALDRAALAAAGALLASAKRPVLWLGGGARHAGEAARAFARCGLPIVTSVQGRGTLPEDDPLSLGSFAMAPSVAALLEQADLLVVVGSHLRSNETRSYSLPLPARRVRVDADAAAQGRGYRDEIFVQADAAEALAALLPFAREPEPGWDAAARAAREAAEAKLRADAGAYAAALEAVAARLPDGAPWVRDITLSNSIWGNRAPVLRDPRQGVHALGGGIGQGLAHAIGAALSRPERKTFALIGDGGFMLNPGELGTAVESDCDLLVLLMNDAGYGVIRNIQDAYYGGRRGYTDLRNPDFAALVGSFGARHARVADAAALGAAMDAALARRGVDVVEVDMTRFGAFGITFAGPPPKK